MKEWIGASEVAAIVGLHRFQSQFQLWAKIHELIPPHPGSDQTRRGHILEPALREWYAEFLKTPVTAGPAYGCTPWQRKDAPWQSARPDGFYDVGEATRGVELKTTNSWDHWGEDGSADVPPDYAVQVLWQQWVCADHLANFTGVDLVAFNRWNDEIRIYRIDYTPAAQAMAVRLAARVTRWWDKHIIGGAPPEADGSDATRETLRAMYGREDNGEMIDPTYATHALVAEYRRASSACDATDAAKESARNRLVAAIGEAAGIKGLCTYKASKPRQTFDTVKFRKEHPDLATAYTTTGDPTRTLKLTKE